MKYNVGSAHGPLFPEDQLRDLPDAIPCQDEIIPRPDSTLLPVLNHPTGKRLEINFAAYDPPELTLSSLEGVHPVLVFDFDSPLEVLTKEQAWSILWVPVPTRKAHKPHDKTHL